MLKTCSICGKIHDFNKTCKRFSTKKFTIIKIQKKLSVDYKKQKNKTKR